MHLTNNLIFFFLRTHIQPKKSVWFSFHKRRLPLPWPLYPFLVSEVSLPSSISIAPGLTPLDPRRPLQIQFGVSPSDRSDLSSPTSVPVCLNSCLPLAGKQAENKADRQPSRCAIRCSLSLHPLQFTRGRPLSHLPVAWSSVCLEWLF